MDNTPPIMDNFFIFGENILKNFKLEIRNFYFKKLSNYIK